MHFYEIELMERIQKFNLAEQMRYISKPFNTFFFIIIIIILYVYKMLDNNDIILLLKGIIICNIIKFIFRRTRPYQANNKIKNFSEHEHIFLTDKYSFPSGHTFMATFFSLIMLNKYPNEFIFNIISILVGFSRIFLGVHYPTDIIGGMIFSFIFHKILS